MDPSELLQPIAGPDPGGASIRYAPVYDQIKLARTEEDDVPQGDWVRERKTADYPLVIKLSTNVLKNQSKDLQVAAWLTEALTRREGFAGLRAGVTLLHGLVEKFWDNLYPELEDGDTELRAAPLDWLGSYLETTVKSVPLNRAGHDFFGYKQSRLVPSDEEAKADRDKLAARQQAMSDGKLTPEAFEESFSETPKPFYKALIAELDNSTRGIETLGKLADERFGDASPSFKKLRDALQEVRQAAGQLLATKLIHDPDPPEPEPSVMDAGADAGSSAAGDAGGLPVMPRSPEDAASRVAAAAKFLRSVAATNPAPYLMLRGLRWGEMRAQGGVVEPMMLSAPPTDVRTRLKTLLLKAQWPQLLDSAEDVMATVYGRGWLDLQRYVLTACLELGSEFENVANAIRGALRSYLRDLPQLLDMTMIDDSPTANAETRNWLREQGLVGGADDEVEVAAPVVSERPRSRRDPFEQAQDRVRAGHPDQAIDLLMREASIEKSERARFLRRSQAASIMVDAGLEAVAMPLLQQISEQIDKHTLEEWESGETVAQALGLLYRCMLKLDEDQHTRDSLYLRVCRLDPMQAIRFKPANNEQPGT